MDRQFNSLSEFIDWLVHVELERDEPWAMHWFRGHPHTALELKPRALRDPADGGQCPLFNQDQQGAETSLEAAERTVNRHFRREAASLLPAPLDDVELYLLAQHHGLPTRLLDWTTNGLAALFFTTVNRPEADGEVIVTTPSWRMTTDDRSDPRAELLGEAPFPQKHSLVRKTVRYLFGEGERPEPPLIVPVLPDLRSPRMLQQGACFTLHLPGSGAVNEQAVVRYRIPRDRKPELLRALRTLGVTWSTLFPDLDHVCQEIRSRWDDAVAKAPS